MQSFFAYAKDVIIQDDLGLQNARANVSVEYLPFLLPAISPHTQITKYAALY